MSTEVGTGVVWCPKRFEHGSRSVVARYDSVHLQVHVAVKALRFKFTLTGDVDNESHKVTKFVTTDNCVETVC